MINDKYKERKPEETVRIIKEWFEKRGLKCITMTTKTSYGTYFSTFDLFCGQHKLANTFGKGVSPEFSLASAFGEMLEVYFGFFGYNLSIFAPIKLEECYPDFVNNKMKKLPVEDLVKDKYINYLLSHNEFDAAQVARKKFGSELNCDEYTNILDGSKKWMSSKMLIHLQGTNGISGGNTWQEAFNQAMSELCERNTIKQLTKNKFKSLHWIKNESIKEPYLKELIKSIENDEKEIYIVDCSYITNQPVVMTIFIDKIANRLYIQFGSFPVFEIALERCLTEASQGTPISFEEEQNQLQTPYKDQNENEIWSNAFKNISSIYCQDENLLDYLVEVDGPSSVYVDKGLTNKEILEYWKDFIKNNNLNVYYKNFSPTEDFASVKVWAEDFGEIQYSHLLYDSYINTSKSDVDSLALLNYKKIIKLISGEYNEDEFLKSFKILMQGIFKDSDLNFYNPHPGLDSFFSNGTYINNYMMNLFGMKDDDKHWFEVEYPFFNHYWIKKYIVLRKYISSRYSEKELLKVGKLLHYNWTQEDIQNCYIENYLIINAIYKPMWDFYHSETYKTIIGSLIGKC